MSVDSVTSLAGGGLSGSGLGALTGSLQGGVNSLLNMSSTWLDRFFPPEKREEWKAWLTKFATERPYLASFLLSQIALSGLPLVLFGVMSVTVFIFALLAGILVGVIGALLFVVAALGFALIILLPTLFFTTAAAVFIWLWGVGAYFIVKWFNQKDIPGIHTDVSSGLAKQSGLSDLPGVGENLLSDENLDLNGALNAAKGEKKPEKLDKADKADKGNEKEKERGATTTGAQHHVDGKENQSQTTTPRKKRPVSTDPTSKVTGTVDGVSKGATGAVGNATKTLGV
ncbi:hypothetical protein B0A52_03381 [Exophiala mesophila]|uniref:Uncharacterized protein n=1 Tax=Exophiala mesophila TaxID=212818 RepID=A0A438N5I7_EXOME|nr:hypothetical protein B0A52_03381 [Exophiala mesophila]